MKIIHNIESGSATFNKNKSPCLSVNQSQEIKDVAEVVVSDLECEIENNDDTNVLNTNNKSFIPIQNHLRTKRNFSQDNATPSYLMALFQYEGKDPNRPSINNSIYETASSPTQENNHFLNNISNSSINNQSLYSLYNASKHNYIVDDVIEEETSENNTDNEMSTRKRYSINFNSYRSNESNMSRKTKKNISSNQLNMNKINYSARNVRHSKSDGNSIKHDNYITNPYTSYYSNESSISYNSPTNLFKKNKFHKNSKSDLINFKVDMKKMIENIEKRRQIDKEERIEKLKLRKNILLNKFYKSNSQHNIPHKFGIGSNIEHNGLFININSPNSVVLDNIYKKLSPSGVSRAIYYDYNYPLTDKINNSKIINKSNFINFEDGDESKEIGLDNESDGEVIENKSIVEIKEDEDINFEAELNIQLQKNDLINEENNYSEDILVNDEKIEQYEMVENEAFAFNASPLSNKITIIKKSVNKLEDVKIRHQDKYNIIQDITENNKVVKSLLSNMEHNSQINTNNNSNNNGNINTNNFYMNSELFTNIKSNNNLNPLYTANFTESNISKNFFKFSTTIKSSNTMSKDLNNKSMAFNSSNSERQYTLPTKLNNYEISPNIKIQLSSSPTTDSNKNIFNNNYINNNINNISINIVNREGAGSGLASGNINSNQNLIKSLRNNLNKNNSISMTNDIRQKYLGLAHNKSTSINLLKIASNNDFQIRSDSFTKKKGGSPISIHSVQNYFENGLNFNFKNKRNSINIHNYPKQLIINTPKKNKFGIPKKDLKHYLIYSDTKDTKECLNINPSYNINNLSSFSSMNNSSNFSNINNQINHNFIINSPNMNTIHNNFFNNSPNENYRVNSETSVNVVISNFSNKKIIQNAINILRFQFSSLDHQRFTIDKLNKSKAKFFCLLICSENNQNNFEYKGLYEVNLEKNNLTKIYSVNYYPNNIEFYEIKYFYYFDIDMNNFIMLGEVRKFTPDIHGFFMQYNYKKFLKG